MKAYLVEQDNGVDYDGYEHWVESVYLVPDDFDESKVYNEVVEHAKRNNLVKITKRGMVYDKDLIKLKKLYAEHLAANFEKLEIYNGER